MSGAGYVLAKIRDWRAGLRFISDGSLLGAFVEGTVFRKAYEHVGTNPFGVACPLSFDAYPDLGRLSRLKKSSAHLGRNPGFGA